MKASIEVKVSIEAIMDTKEEIRFTIDPQKVDNYNVVYACDRCGGPTFDDAPTWAVRYDAVIGDMKVICNRCAQTHEVVVRRKLNVPAGPIHMHQNSWVS